MFQDTPLNLVTRSGNFTLVKWLVENGADVQKANDKGKNPLFYAQKGGYPDIAEYLKAII